MNVLAATLVAAALRLFRLGAQSLWIDEVFTWMSSGIGTPLAARDLLENLHGPLYSLILHAWTSVAGDSERAMRLPSAVFGIATVPALAWLARRWLGRRPAIAAAWLGAASPFLVWYSQEARNYALLLLCTCASGALLLGLVERPGRLRAAGYLGSAAAGLLSNLSFALVLPMHLMWWLRDRGTRARRMRGVAIGCGVLALVALPWAPQALRTWDWSRLQPGRAAAAGETPLRGSHGFNGTAVPYALYAFAAGYTFGPPLRSLRTEGAAGALARHGWAVAAVALVFGAAGVLGLRALARRRRLSEALVWVLVPVGCVSYFALQNFKVFHPRYVMVALPACLLAVAAGLADLRPRPRAALAVAIGVLWTLSLANHFGDPRYGREDYRGAIAAVRAGASPGERIVALGADDPVFYYYRGPMPVERLWLGLVNRPARLDQLFGEELAGATGAWIVLSRPEDLDPEGRFVRLMEARFPHASSRRFEGVRIWHVTAEDLAGSGLVARTDGGPRHPNPGGRPRP